MHKGGICFYDCIPLDAGCHRRGAKYIYPALLVTASKVLSWTNHAMEARSSLLWSYVLLIAFVALPALKGLSAFLLII